MAAIALASSRTAGIASSVSGEMTGAGTMASWPANSSHAQRPASRPSGTPTIRPAQARAVACQATVARTWLVTNPTVLRIARSRRRRRTDVSSVCAMIPQASSISTKARMSGRPLTPDRSRTSGGGTAGSTVPGNCCFRL